MTDDAISLAEEGEIHRIASELRIDHPDLVALRVATPATSSRDASTLIRAGR